MTVRRANVIHADSRRQPAPLLSATCRVDTGITKQTQIAGRRPSSQPAPGVASTTRPRQRVRSRYWSSSLSVPRMKKVPGSIVSS